MSSSNELSVFLFSSVHTTISFNQFYFKFKQTQLKVSQLQSLINIYIAVCNIRKLIINEGSRILYVYN